MKLFDTVLGSYVIGFDSDDKETAQRTVDAARKEGIRSIQMWILSPLIGTDFRSRIEKEGRLLSNNPRDCDGTRVMFIPAQMTAEELQESVFAGMKRFYSLKNRLVSIFQGIGSLVKNYAVNTLNTKVLWRESLREAIMKWYGRSVIKAIEKRAKKYLSQLGK